MSTRRVVLAALAVVALAVGGLFAAAALVPAGRVSAAVAERAGALLGRPVSIAETRVRAFPLPRVVLTGIAVDGEAGDALAGADVAVLRVRLLPLLRGRVVIAGVKLDRARLLLEIDHAGRPNLPLPGDPAPTAPQDVEFALTAVDISGGRLAYRDLRDGTAVRLDGWDQRLRLSDSGGGRDDGDEAPAVRAAGWLAVADVDALLPGVVIPVRDRSVRLSYDALVDRTLDRLELRSLGALLDGVPFTGSGRIDATGSATDRRVTLTLSAHDVPARELLRWAPERARTRLEARGIAWLTVDVAGPLTLDSFPGLDGTLTVTDLAMDVDGRPLVDDARADGVFSADSAVVQLAGRFLGDRFTAGAALRNPSSPSLVLALGARAELDRLAPLGLVPDSLGLAGSVRTDLQVLVRLDSPAASVMAGSIDVTGLRLGGLRRPVEVPYATLTLQGPRARIEPVPVRVGGAELMGGIATDGWIAALVDSAAPPPEVVAEVRGVEVDLDSLLGSGGSLPPPPPMDAELVLRADRLILNALEYAPVALRITMAAAAGNRRIGLDVATPRDGERLEADLGALLDRLLPASPPAP